MPYSSVTYTGTGITGPYAVTFPYIDRTHVKAYLNGVATTAFTWLTSSSIQFSSAVTAGVSIVLQRETPKDARLVDYADATVLLAADLDKSDDQNFFVAQELIDAGLLGSVDGTLNASGKRISNVANGVNSQDAVTMSQLASAAIAPAGTLAVANGGTGGTTAAAARTNLGAAASGANTDITSLNAPALGAATATTQASSDNSTKVATTAMVQSALPAAAAQSDVDTGTNTTKFLTAGLNRTSIAAVQSTTSGTTKDFLGIPSGTRRIRVFVNGVGLAAGAFLVVRIGVGSTPDTSGYSGAVGNYVPTANFASMSAGFRLWPVAASGALLSECVLDLIDPTTNTWMANINSVQTAPVTGTGLGVKALSGVLGVVQLTTETGQTFNAGSVSLSYER